MRFTDVIRNIGDKTFIISDLHLGHKNILEFEPSRSRVMKEEGYENHEEWLVDRWNKTVPIDATVLVLGDFAFKGVQEYIQKLNGDIVVILGNHDSSPRGEKWKGATVINGVFIQKNDYILEVKDEFIRNDSLMSALIKDIDGKRIMISHYALFNEDEWDRQNKKISPRIKFLENLYLAENCDYNVHGHLHSEHSTFKDSINVSLEHINFKPTQLSKILNKKD